MSQVLLSIEAQSIDEQTCTAAVYGRSQDIIAMLALVAAIRVCFRFASACASTEGIFALMQAMPSLERADPQKASICKFGAGLKERLYGIPVLVAAADCIMQEFLRK